MFKKKTTWLVIAFVALFIWFLAGEAQADTLIEGAPAVAYAGKVEKGQFAVMAHERFQGKYDVGVILLVDAAGGEEGNRGLEALRVVRKGRWEAGIGWAFWANQGAAWNATDTFALVLGYEWDHWGVRWRHWSTGGTSSRNSGLDMLTVGYRFK